MRKLIYSILIVLATINVLHAQISIPMSLKVGDSAPPLKVARWLKGDAVNEFKKGHVYVVEFWATWCAPCRKGMPHLSELAEKYRGKATVLSINIQETSRTKNKIEDYMPNVERVVKSMGNAMRFVVGADGPDNAMNRTWMRASGPGGIPRAYVIGKDGKLLWFGAPADGLDEALELAVSGWENEAWTELEQKIKARKFKLEQLTVTDYGTAIRAKDYPKAIAICEEINSINPHTFNGVHFATMKYKLLAQTDHAKAKEYAPKFLELYKKSPLALQELANSIMGTSITNMIGNVAEKDRDYKFALQLLESAAKFSDPQDPVLLSSLAEANYLNGDKENALRLQETALGYLDQTTLEIPDERKKLYHAQLEKYRH